MKKALALAAFALVLAMACPAEVVDSAPNGITVRSTLVIQAPPGDVYQKLVKNVGDWWNSAHTFSQDAHNMTIDDKPGGCFCEKLPGGGGVQHFEVAMSSPGKFIMFRGAMGPMLSQAVMGSLEITLVPDGAGTKLTATLRAGGYMPNGVNSMAGPADMVVAEQFTRLKSYIEKGTPETKAAAR
jgi:uncharacterized protein YndB with AHSA1/START domain